MGLHGVAWGQHGAAWGRMVGVGMGLGLAYTYTACQHGVVVGCWHGPWAWGQHGRGRMGLAWSRMGPPRMGVGIDMGLTLAA
jgi:hypothetical protein